MSKITLGDVLSLVVGYALIIPIFGCAIFTFVMSIEGLMF